MTVRVEHIMGTAVRFDAEGRAPRRAAIGSAVAYLRWVEQVFSVYRPDSQISMIANAELTPEDATPVVARVLDRCRALRILTDGWFDHRPDTPALDPSGYVKGWAIQQAAGILEAAGLRRFSIDAGGDVVVRGGGWRIGIADPARPQAARAVVVVDDGAVATSGRYARGEHVWGRPGSPVLAGVTVVGPDLGTADALATALLAADGTDTGWLEGFPGYEVVAIEADGRLRATPAAPIVATTVPV